MELDELEGLLEEVREWQGAFKAEHQRLCEAAKRLWPQFQPPTLHFGALTGRMPTRCHNFEHIAQAKQRMIGR